MTCVNVSLVEERSIPINITHEGLICTWLLNFIIRSFKSYFSCKFLLSQDTDVAEKLSSDICAYWTEMPVAALGLMSDFVFTLQRRMTGMTGAVAVVLQLQFILV